MDRLEAVLKHLKLSREEWSIINEKRQDILFKMAEKEMRRASKKNNKGA